MSRPIIVLAATLVAAGTLTACGTMGQSAGATAELAPTGAISPNPTMGKVSFTPLDHGVRVSGEVRGLPPGTEHGFHIHEKGDCGDNGNAAGGHFNPSEKHHGLHNPAGAHAGDLPNLVVGKDGKAKATFTAKGATLGEGKGSLFGPDGTALVIHADPDDEKTDPAGNSGARIACGIVERK